MANIKAEILKLIEDRLSEISPETVKIYKDKFSSMSDNELRKYLKTSKVRLYVDDKKVTPKAVSDLVKKSKMITQEKLILPEKDNAITNSEIIVVPVQIRRLQQLSRKESNSNMDITRRDKGGQASGASKTGKLNDDELNQLIGMGMDRTITELFSPRSDNLNAKKQMNEELDRDLEFSLDHIETDVHDRQTLVLIDACYKCMNLATDLVDEISLISY